MRSRSHTAVPLRSFAFNTLGTAQRFESFSGLFDQAAKTPVSGKFTGKALELIADRRPAADVEQIGDFTLTLSCVTDQD